jgi:hypothetical protein
MGWSFRRSKSFGLFRFNFSKSGMGVSFGVPGARIGINSKGKKYVRGGVPGTGLYYQQTLPDDPHAQAGQPQSANSVSPLVVLLVLLVAGLIVYGIIVSSVPKPTPAPVVQQAVAPVVAPVAPKTVAKHHKKRRPVHPTQIPAMGDAPKDSSKAESKDSP